MLIALFTILILGGGSTGLLDYIGETEDNIKIVMEKDDRRTAALGNVKNMQKRTKTRNKQVKRAAKELNKTLANHNVTNADIDAVWSVYFEEIESYNKDMLELRFELRNRLTREEWRAVFAEDQPE